MQCGWACPRTSHRPCSTAEAGLRERRDRAARRRRRETSSYEATSGTAGELLLDGLETTARWDADLDRLLAELGEHYGVAILPARPAHPKDKAKVEVGVQVVERWILARLRHQLGRGRGGGRGGRGGGCGGRAGRGDSTSGR